MNGTTYLGSVAVYECDPDYWLDGPKMRTCLKDGRWTGERPLCFCKFGENLNDRMIYLFFNTFWSPQLERMKILTKVSISFECIS